MAVAERGSDAMRLYLNDIGKHDLLEAEDERRLGKAIRDGQLAEEKLQSKGLDTATKVKLR
ncbi:MAG: sigma-70 factor domain-containing protein, partial [Actinomycetota bacterium]